MSRKPSLLNLNQLADYFKVSRRTLFRWQRQGVDLSNRDAIARHIANQSRSSPQAVAAAIHYIRTVQNYD
jgi:phage terminase Nu1 subunit (DNA packaging protein)